MKSNKIVSCTIAMVVTMLMAVKGYSEDLSYKWQTGKSYFFSATVNDDVNTSVMGMQVNEQFKTQSDFVLWVTNVDASGIASGYLYITKFSVTDSKGRTLASLNDIPPKAVKSMVKVDRKGKFTFVKKLYLITSGSSNVLAYGRANGNSASVGGQAGNMRVDAYAEFDPNTGRLKAGYNVKTVKNTTQVSVKVTEETDKIDVIPYAFLELLALPEGDVAQGDEVTAQTGMYKTNVKVTDMNGGIATINHTMATDKSADMFSGRTDGKKGDGSGSFGMGMENDMNNGTSNTDMNMSDMGMDMDMDMSMDMGMDDGMGMDAEDQAAMGMAKGMAPNMSCNVVSQFNYRMGMFQEVGGTVTTKINSMGMKMTINSKLQMKYVE